MVFENTSIKRAIDASGRAIKCFKDTGGNYIQQVIDPGFLLEVAKGNIPKHSIVNKFGLNESAASPAEIISDLSQVILPMPVSATVVSIVSTSPQDSVAGTGISALQFFGIDNSWNLQDENIVLTGTTPVLTPVNTYLRIFKMKGTALGSASARGGSNIGTITASIGGVPIAQINIGQGRTLMAVYTVPVAHNLYLNRAYGSVLKSGGGGGALASDIHLRSIGESGVNTMRAEFGSQNTGSTYVDHEFVGSELIEEKTDIFLQSNQSATAEIGGGFSGVLVEN